MLVWRLVLIYVFSINQDIDILNTRFSLHSIPTGTSVNPIAVLVLMFSTGCSEPTTLTENVFTYFGIEAFALALIKVADTVKEATDKFEPSKKKRKREEKGDD